MAETISLSFTIEGSPVVRKVRGRYAWTLAQLIAAGETGVTPIERPAPRWSHYVHFLRTEHGLNIETIEERHAGPFKGWHGRYVLHTPVDVVERETAA